MTRISYEEFQKRFKLITEFKSQPMLLKKRYRDILHRRNILSFEYIELTAEERDRIFGEFFKLYHEEYSIQLICYCERSIGTKFDLIFLMNECVSLNEFLFDKKKQKVLTLTFKEVLYLFKRVSKILHYYHNLGYAHGDLTEGSLYIDQDQEVRMMFYPNMATNIEKAALRLSIGKDLQYTGYLLTPEQLGLLYNRHIPDFDPSECSIDKYKCDIFSLGLMCLRIISPKSFYDSYNLEDLEIDMKRLYVLVDTLGVFINSTFCAIMKHCLAFDQKYRPGTNYLLEEMDIFNDLPTCLNKSPIERPDEESQCILEDVFSGSDNISLETSYDETVVESTIDRFSTLNQTGYDNLDSSVPMGRQINRLREKFAPLKFSFSKKYNGINLMKKDALRFLEDKIYSSLPSRKLMNRSFGELTYKVKILPDNKKVGFIIYPNGDIYFGYLRDLKRNDIGIYFLNNGEVYHGEFRKGKIEGTGVYIFKNGDVFEGQWKENVLHGKVKMYSRKKNRTYSCTFYDGEMTSKKSKNLELANTIDLTEFYGNFITKTQIIEELSRYYLEPSQRLTVRYDSYTAPITNTKRSQNDHLKQFKKYRDVYLGIVDNTIQGNDPLASLGVPEENEKSPVEQIDPDRNEMVELLQKKREERNINSILAKKEDDIRTHKKPTILEEYKEPEKVTLKKERKLDEGSQDERKIPEFKDTHIKEELIEDDRDYAGNTSRTEEDFDENHEILASIKLTETHDNLNLSSDQIEIYEGGKNDEGLSHGYGQMKMKNGCRFFGNFDNGIAHGKGTFCYPDGKIIDGVWQNGYFQK